jgi:hypothetical protein
VSNKNRQYDILDKILGESQENRNEVVWVSDPRHPQGGYYTQAVDGQPATNDKFQTADDIERYLRS